MHLHPSKLNIPCWLYGTIYFVKPCQSCWRCASKRNAIIDKTHGRPVLIQVESFSRKLLRSHSGFPFLDSSEFHSFQKAIDPYLLRSFDCHFVSGLKTSDRCCSGNIWLLSDLIQILSTWSVPLLSLLWVQLVSQLFCCWILGIFQFQNWVFFAIINNHHYLFNVHFLTRIIMGLDGCFPTAYGRRPIYSYTRDFSFSHNDASILKNSI